MLNLLPMRPGFYIKATALLKGDYFENAVIYIVEMNNRGALGFLINKKFSRRFNELHEFRHSPAFPLYEGGPVDQEHIFVVHQRADLIPESDHVADNMYRSGNFEEIVKYINNGKLSEDDIRLFLGYCGWDKDGLEAEIAEGSWEITDQVSLFPKN